MVFVKRVRETSANELFEPIFLGQVSLDCESNFACIGAIKFVARNESVWIRTIEPVLMNSDHGASLQSDWINRRGYIVSTGRIWIEKSKFLQENGQQLQ